MFNRSEAKALREQRSAAHAVAVSVLAQKTLTAESRATYEKAFAEVDRLGKRIAEIENVAGPGGHHWTPSDSKREMAFSRYLRHGKEVLSGEEQRMMETRDGVVEGTLSSHVGTYSGLGYFVPTGFVQAIEQATKWFCPFLDGDVCTVIETATGAPLPYPVADDTGNTATIVGETNPVSELDVTANQVVLNAFKLTSGLIKASTELLQDSAFDLDSYIAERMGERWGRGLESYLTTGSGSGQPTGLLTAIAASGASTIVAAGSSESTGGSQTGANSIGYSDLVNLEHSVDPSYRRGARYMFHDQTLSLLKRILDKYGRPLWTPGIAVSEPPTLNGYPYVINQHMPTVTSVSEAVTVIFGDFKKFVVRKVKDMSVLRLGELYAVTGQVGFVSFARIDSNAVYASTTAPLNTLTMHS